MIEIARPVAPAQLTPQLVSTMTQQFQSDGSRSPWNATFLRQALLNMSHGKCAYCEARVDEESKYMEVDHFFCKRDHSHLVADWANLLPACKRCNINKGAHNVSTQGALIDPTTVRPKDHIFLHQYRLFGRDDLGSRTIEVLYLNQSDRVVRVRFELGEAISETIEKLTEDAAADTPHEEQARRTAKTRRGIESLFREALPPSEYSATAATVIVAHPRYNQLKANLEATGAWDVELDQLEQKVLAAALI